MISKVIQKQLGQVKVADLSNYNEATKTYLIPKVSAALFDLYKCYIIKVDKSLLNSSSNFAKRNGNVC